MLDRLRHAPDESGGTPDATPAAAELAEEEGVDLEDVEGTGKEGRITKADVEAAADDSEPSGRTEEELPLITTSTWVRLNNHSTVPKHLRGRDAVVLRAPSVRCEADDFSTVPYEKQDSSTVFLVRARDDGTELELKRNAFAYWGPSQNFGSQ